MFIWLKDGCIFSVQISWIWVPWFKSTLSFNLLLPVLYKYRFHSLKHKLDLSCTLQSTPFFIRIYIRVEIRHYKTWWRNEHFSFYTYTWANMLVCLISSLFYCKLIIFMLSTTDLDPQKRFYHITFIWAILCWFIENVSF